MTGDRVGTCHGWGPGRIRPRAVRRVGQPVVLTARRGAGSWPRAGPTSTGWTFESSACSLARVRSGLDRTLSIKGTLTIKRGAGKTLLACSRPRHGSRWYRAIPHRRPRPGGPDDRDPDLDVLLRVPRRAVRAPLRWQGLRTRHGGRHADTRAVSRGARVRHRPPVPLGDAPAQRVRRGVPADRARPVARRTGVRGVRGAARP